MAIPFLDIEGKTNHHHHTDTNNNNNICHNKYDDENDDDVFYAQIDGVLDVNSDDAACVSFNSRGRENRRILRRDEQ